MSSQLTLSPNIEFVKLKAALFVTNSYIWDIAIDEWFLILNATIFSCFARSLIKGIIYPKLVRATSLSKAHVRPSAALRKAVS